MTALRKFLGPPYKLSDLISIFLTFVVFLTIPIIVLGALEGQNPIVKAKEASCQNSPNSQPLVTFYLPKEGAHLTGKMYEIILESASPCISNVQLFIDSVFVKSFKTEPYIYGWDISNIPPGNHKIEAKSFSFAGKSQATSLTIYRGVKEIILR